MEADMTWANSKALCEQGVSVSFIRNGVCFAKGGLLLRKYCFLGSAIIQYFNQMQTFRKKYIYNPDKPMFESPNVRTFGCMNTETKDKQLILIQHLTEPPFIEPEPSILQPIEIPTLSQPFSIYPIVRCVSEIGKVSEPEAMYIIKCLSACKLKNPLYSVIGPQGICCSEVEGLLPNKSPDLFNLAIDLLDIPANLSQVEKSVISKEGYGICRAIRNGESIKGSLENYGWKDIKKEKDKITDPDFIVFHSRRKEDGPFGEEYGLAWHNEHGLARMKYIGLQRDGYEQEFFKDFSAVVEYIEKNAGKKNLFLNILKYEKDQKGIRIFTQIANQGTLQDYIAKKSENNQALTEKNSFAILDVFIKEMARFSSESQGRGLATLHIKSLYVHNNRIVIGEPQLITDKCEKKLRELKNSMDYYAPEMKENIILPENLVKMDKEKMDTWSFGLILHKILTREVPIFDPAKKPVLSKDKLSDGMIALINRCLDQNPAKRPKWSEINLKDIEKFAVMIEDVKEDKNEREEIRLWSRENKRSEKSRTSEKKKRMIEELEEQEEEREKKRKEEERQAEERQAEEENEKLRQEEEEEVQIAAPIPTEISSRLKKIKLIFKIIIVMVFYIFIFFRPFLGNSIAILMVRSHYTTTTLHLVDYDSNELSSTTLLTDDPLFFLKNDISFAQVQNEYRCINDNFDPIYNPDYSLLTYVQSSRFLALLLTGWLTAIMICVTKALSIWRGGISNRPPKNQGKYWGIYAFHELTLAALLFAHFYIYQFFYFAGATPCFSIDNFTGLEPFFDSSLYLFLSNTDGYFQQVFSTLGVLSIFLALSSCFYAWGPKLDQKHFLSIPSIIFRIIPYLLLLLICRIGVFMLFSPTAINDSTQILPAIISGSFTGFIGIIPEMFILLCLLMEILIELFMYWCERKAAESDQLAKLFNIRKKKTNADNDASRINDMSIIDNSRHKLDISSLEHY